MQKKYNVENLHRNKFISAIGGKRGWTPERRAAQAARLALVRLSGVEASELAMKREASRRRSRAVKKHAKSHWTPERRRAQSGRLQLAMLTGGRRAMAGQSLRDWHVANKLAKAKAGAV